MTGRMRKRVHKREGEPVPARARGTAIAQRIGGNRPKSAGHGLIERARKQAFGDKCALRIAHPVGGAPRLAVPMRTSPRHGGIDHEGMTNGECKPRS